MMHCSDDDLILHYYGEEARHAAHLDTCAECAARFQELAATLQAMTPPEIPDRPDHYGLEVWHRIRHQLPERAPWYGVLWNWRWLTAGAAAALLIMAGFTAGRLWPSASVPASIDTRAPAGTEDIARRVLLLTVADHLEQSDRVLTELVNAPGGLDISSEQAWASDLVAANRLYRQEALDADETSVAAVLDELERTLLEVVHRPSRLSDNDVAELRRRVDSAALLFKVRVLSTDLRELTDPADAPSSSPTRTIG